MSSFELDDLLSTLVENIRQACEQHITFKDFTSVSGLICFDIDGFKQQCFVISELLQKQSVGEGQSAHLKTLNWKDIDRSEPVVWHASKCISSKSSHIEKPNNNRPSDGQTELPEGLSGPQNNFIPLQPKLDWSNRTFTLKPVEQYHAELSHTYAPENKSATTVTISKNAQKEDKQKYHPGQKKDVYQGITRQIYSNGKKQPKLDSSKLNTHYRHCYPGLPKKPMKRCKPFHNEIKLERQMTMSSNESKSEPLKETNRQDDLKHIKALYNSPSEKPTALSWFETMISPSSSFESIDSIQPCYLVPHSEPLSNSPHYKSEAKSVYENYEHHQSATQPSAYDNYENTVPPRFKLSSMNSAQYTGDGRQDRHITAPMANQESPLKTIAAHSTTSNGTLNTISSIEADESTVKESSPQKSNRAEIDHALKIAHVESQILSECSAVSKKRASLMKWMGLFKKGPKTSGSEVGEEQKHAPKAKRKNMPDPPIEIRLKQWN